MKQTGRCGGEPQQDSVRGAEQEPKESAAAETQVLVCVCPGTEAET